jgi:hypothetical protein
VLRLPVFALVLRLAAVGTWHGLMVERSARSTERLAEALPPARARLRRANAHKASVDDHQFTNRTRSNGVRINPNSIQTPR